MTSTLLGWSTHVRGVYSSNPGQSNWHSFTNGSPPFQH